MFEHERLRARLKNITRGTNEYKMTVAEAKSLLTEFDEMMNRKPVKVEPIVMPATRPPILDGGAF
jgi:hypothetical protein